MTSHDLPLGFRLNVADDSRTKASQADSRPESLSHGSLSLGAGAGRVYVVIVNWNRWADTIECLESVYRSDYPSYRVMVCDNGSTDESVGRLRAWARGEVPPPPARSAELRHLAHPPVPKPVALEVLDLGANLGYARANNVALRSILAQGEFEHVWLLNNDTVVARGALSRMVERMREKPRAGLCGSTLLFYDAPERVQALGGATYDPRLGICRNLGGIARSGAPSDPAPVESRMAYVMGASILVSKPFLREVGLLDEDYFLYFEELDWATRGRDRFSLAWAPQSLVYHKAGASTGLYERRHAAAVEYHMARSLLLYARRHTPSWLPLIHLRHLLVIVASLATGRWRRAHAMVRLYVSLMREGSVSAQDT